MNNLTRGKWKAVYLVDIYKILDEREKVLEHGLTYGQSTESYNKQEAALDEMRHLRGLIENKFK